MLAAALHPAIAQQAPGTASVSGIVFDSIRGHPMSGAQVGIQGTTLLAVADGDGRFHLDSVPPGTYRMVASHPILDSLGISLVTPPITLAAGQSRTVDMATPSASALVGQLCPAAWLTRGPAALFGRIRNADTDQPLGNARVSVVWTELELGGLRKVPHIRAATTDADGTYRICGLPATLDGKVQVALAGRRSGDVPVTLNNEVLAVRSLSLGTGAAVVATAPAAATAGDTVPVKPRTMARARLTGRVLSVTGEPVAGARVQLEGTTRIMNTPADGSFELDSLPSGTQVVIARRIGYNPVEQVVELSSGSADSVTLRFEQAVSVLPTVTTEAQRTSGLQAVGFTTREKMGTGFFLDEQQIDRRQADRFTDLMRAVPGFRVQTSGFDTYVYDVRQTGTNCVNYVVDGTPWVSMSPGDVNSFLLPQNVGAMEVYHAGQTPAEFIQPTASGCATVVIWTKWRLSRGGPKR
jgi:hypothetical protein